MKNLFTLRLFLCGVYVWNLENIDWIEVVKNLFTLGLFLCGVYVWKRQQRWKAKYELLNEVVPLVYEFIANLKNSYFSHVSFPSLDHEEGKVDAKSLLSSLVDNENLLSKLKSTPYRMEHFFGKNGRGALENLIAKELKLREATKMLIDHENLPSGKEMQQLIINFNENDGFTKALDRQANIVGDIYKKI